MTAFSFLPARLPHAAAAQRLKVAAYNIANATTDMPGI